MSDIIFKTDDWVFSYRVAGILIHNNKLFLQKPTNDTGFALPGGHVSLGETNVETLIREFKEEIGADITVGDLKWVGELFFPWDDRPCHQIGLYYSVQLKEKSQIPLDGSFIGLEQIEGRNFDIEFHWIPLDEMKNIEIYPTNVPDLLSKIDEGVQHFIFREE